MTLTPVERARYEADRMPVRRSSSVLHVLQGLASIGAAARAAAAADAGRKPDPADLRMLGIEGPLPRLR